MNIFESSRKVSAAKFKVFTFCKAIAIFDGDKKDFKKEVEIEYPDYNFLIIPMDDICDKEERVIAAKDGNLRAEYAEEMKVLLEKINAYFSRG